jgi:hypothetical protein
MGNGGTGVPPVRAQVENLCHQIKEMVGNVYILPSPSPLLELKADS